MVEKKMFAKMFVSFTNILSFSDNLEQNLEVYYRMTGLTLADIQFEDIFVSVSLPNFHNIPIRRLFSDNDLLERVYNNITGFVIGGEWIKEKQNNREFERIISKRGDISQTIITIIDTLFSLWN